MFAIPLLALCLAVYPKIASGFSFTIDNNPQQCQNLSISITGSGQPPYTAVIFPFGPTPLPNNTEVRKILDLQFSGNSTSLEFQLAYPANSQFVVTVSDSTGFGTGGTSAAVQVLSSSTSTCFGNTQVVPAFDFSTVPANQLVQCSPMRIWWDPTQSQGNVQFFSIIPGGQSFQISEGNLTTVPDEGLGFNWTVPVRIGTTVLLVGGDSRGIGSAGSFQQNIQQGVNGPDNSCLSSSSPSSTPGSPAGGAYPTNTNGGGTGGWTSGSGSTSHTGAIAGGVVGGVAGLAAILVVFLFFSRSKRVQANEKTHNSVDLLQGDHEDGVPGRGDLPQFYQPEPFMVPEPTIASSQGRLSYDHRQSTLTSTTGELLRSGTPDLQTQGVGSTGGSNQTRKSPLGPAQLRPVNVIQHDDAGDTEQGDEAQETIELPPAYTHIRRLPGNTMTTNGNDANEAAPSSST